MLWIAFKELWKIGAKVDMGKCPSFLKEEKKVDSVNSRPVVFRSLHCKILEQIIRPSGDLLC